MKIHFSSAVCAAALLVSGISVDAVLAPASADVSVSVNFNTFHDQLSPYGDWVYSDRWGEVWIPQDVPANFHPYGTRGHWVYTDNYGWVWDSSYEWGDIPFHYGRWVNDPDDGWLWIPGYVWSPGWVVWRSNDRYTGWMPMPPDDEFLGRGNRGGPSFGISIGGGGGLGFSIDFNNTNDYYGYSRWYGRDYDENRFASNWMFIDTGHIADRDYGRYQAPRSNYGTLIRTTNNITNYTIINNYVVNRSVDVHQVERASGRSVQPVRAADVFKRPQFVTRADTGNEVQTRMREQNPRGTGEAGSAPKPPPSVIETLSNKVPVRNGRQPAHLFTRDTVKTAPLPEKPVGVPTTSPVTGAPNANPLTGAPNANPTGANPTGPGGAPGEKGRHRNEGGGATTNPLTGAPTANPTGPDNTGPSGKRNRGNKNVGAPANPPAEMPNPPKPDKTGAPSDNTTPNAVTPPTPPSSRNPFVPGETPRGRRNAPPATENPPAATGPDNAPPDNMGRGNRRRGSNTNQVMPNNPGETPGNAAGGAQDNATPRGDRGPRAIPPVRETAPSVKEPVSPDATTPPDKGAGDQKGKKKHKPDEPGAPQ